MPNTEVTRKELLQRWSVIEQEDDDDDVSSIHPVKRRRLRELKEQWFSDAFKFLMKLPKETHVWCGYWDLMGPLLETFYNYFKEGCTDSPLKLLWKRICEELRSCTLCIHQHHQAQEMYATEYDQSSIGPLLGVLCILDEERITQHLKDLHSRIAKGDYDTERDTGEVVSVMFESELVRCILTQEEKILICPFQKNLGLEHRNAGQVLMFPILLDDQSLAMEFQIFIEGIDNSHELALDEHQRYPGVYALLFFKNRRVRSIGLRLAGHMGKLRSSTELDPLQFLLKKCISVLEAEGMQLATEKSRPRVELDRLTVWLGIKALLGFLEPPAFEEGILDRYPVFLSIVLNHISDDSLEFSHAVNCLRLMFEKLGCKLWLRASLSPSVMRNTLLGQCFHTRNEKSHKEIFDLFQPFLQSLEALQDGDHEKQRRHFLFFLLHQVPVSSNFSVLMRKKACQIALLIVLRGYRMDPPCPPSECTHMWGPSLVSSLKDSSLHNSLRQPAVDLIQTIIVSDASALISVILNGCLHPGDKPIGHSNPNDVEEEILSHLHVEDNNRSCWKEFNLQHKTMSLVDGSWMCTPMLWFDVLVDVDPLVLPLSFSKAVLWALSRFSLVEPENSTDVTLSFRNWSATYAPEISYLLGWKVPSGSNDGGDGIESRNSIRISTMCLPLVRAFKRLTAHYTVRIGQGELRKQWTWEPLMSNSLILMLVDPNDNTRQVGRLILEQVSNVRGLTGGLHFLCCTPSSLLALLFGLRHALKLVQLDSVLSKFQTLHHMFFILCKLLREGYTCVQSMPQSLSDVSDISKTSLQGGFLKQPLCDLSSTDSADLNSPVSSKLRKKFSCLLSQAAWPSILKCLESGKTFSDYIVSQMTCIRILEVIPVVFERLPNDSGLLLEAFDNMKWLHDLVDWGKSSLAVVVRYWKETLVYLLGQFKAICGNKSVPAVSDIERLISCEKVSMDDLSRQVARLLVSLKDVGFVLKKNSLPSSCSPSRLSLNGRTISPESEITVVGKANVNNIDLEPLTNLEAGHVIILSDDEREPELSSCMQHSNCRSGLIIDVDNLMEASAGKRKIATDLSKNVSGVLHTASVSEEVRSDVVNTILTSQSPVQEEQPRSDKKDIEIKDNMTKDKLNLTKSSDGTVPSKHSDAFASQMHASDKPSSDLSMVSPSNACQGKLASLQNSANAIHDVVCDSDNDAWKFSFFKPPRHPQPSATKPNYSGPKRQVIQLALPVENRQSSMRLGGRIKRFQPPRLDDWYRPILELDFFAAVGSDPGIDKDNQNVGKLKEVPVHFQSPDEYIEIFRPLVLEEFKAQMLSSYQEMVSADDNCCGSLSVLSVERIDDFYFVRFVLDENESAGSKNMLENDLVLITRQPRQNSASDIHTLGKIERREKHNKRRSNFLVIRLYLQGSPRLNRVRTLLTERSQWYVSHIMSIIPQLREFQALSSIREIPLLPIILNPVNHPCAQHESRTENLNKLPQPLLQTLKSSYNCSQLQAINLAVGSYDLKEFELTLIQGPPGTGKTRTVVAIVSGLFGFSQMKDSKALKTGGPLSQSGSISNQRMSQSAAVARAWQDAALARQMNEEVKGKDKSSCTRGRILICAQSNAAVDELVARISSEGLFGCHGEMYKPYLVRVGNAKTVHPNSLPFFIDTLVENRLAKEKMNAVDETKSDTCPDSLTILRANLEKLVDKIRHYEAERASLQEMDSESKNLGEEDCGQVKELCDVERKVKLKTLYDKKKAMYADLANAQATEKKANEEIRALRHKFRTVILKEAEIVVTTLSGCGGDVFGVCSGSATSHKFVNSPEATLFDAVLIDEAAQALEPATLIPLQLLKSKGSKCIMVGDPKQLPATVLSNVASKYLFQCSMFERFQRAGHPIIMLNQQYRMHPEICRFPSFHFYEGKLLNGEHMSCKAAPFHETRCLGPYVFFDIIDGQEIRGTSSLSLYNECEADAAVEVVRFFRKSYPSEFFGGRIGIITPYKRQLSLLRSRFSSAFGSSISSDMEFNTVDGFQGREVDVLLLSTVRAAGLSTGTLKSGSSTLGFVADVRRMNVALTRAKLSLWIFGNARTLRTNQTWAALVEDAKQRNLLVSARKPYSSIYKLSENRSSGFTSNIQMENVEKVKAKSERVNMHASNWKRKSTATAEENVESGEGAVEDAAKDGSGRQATSSRQAKDMEVVTTNSCIQTLKDAKSKLDVNEKKNDKNKEIDVVKADFREGNNNDHARGRLASTGKVENQSQKCPRPRTNEMHLGNRQSSKQPEQKVSASASERRFEEKDGRGGCSNVGMVDDSIRKRKQQREAVDALLSSALISSKKSNQSVKPSVKRNLSTTDKNDDPVRHRKQKK